MISSDHKWEFKEPYPKDINETSRKFVTQGVTNFLEA